MLESFEDRTVPTALIQVFPLADAHEGGADGGVQLVRSMDLASALTVNYTVSGNATPGSDYTALSGSVSFAPFQITATVTVAAIDDGATEPVELVGVTLAPGSGYVVGGPSWAPVLIFDNETPEVSVTKVADATEGGTNGTFRFTRLGDLSSGLTANYSVSGTATSGTDYTALSGTVTFAAGVSTSDVNVTTAEDDLLEGTETVTATVTSGTGYTVGATSTADALVIDKVYSNTFDWNGVATVQVLVTYDAPGHTGDFLWSYHLTNTSFSDGIANFALPAEDSGMVSNLTNSLGWSGSVGTFLSNSDLVAWSGGTALGIGNSADFSFTTDPVEVALTNGIISDVGVTTLPAGFLAVPTAAPIPPGPAIAPMPTTVLVSTSLDKEDNRGGTSLREAINWADNQNLPNQQLKVKFTKAVAGSIFTLTKQLPISHNIFINGTDRDITVEGLGSDGDFRLIFGDVGSNIQIAGLTLQDGGGDDFAGDGGAIHARGALILQGCTIRANTTTAKGGGVYCEGSLLVEGCTIKENGAISGGGIYAAGASTTIRGVRQGDGWVGDIAQNEALHSGGGLYVVQGMVTLEDMVVTLNKTTQPVPLPFVGEARGGGIFIAEQVTNVNIKHTYVSDNNSTGSSGGILISGGAGGVVTSVTLEDCKLYDNTALTSGGGLSILGGTLTVISTEITNNKVQGGADGYGGGIFVGDKVAAVSFSNSYIAGNEAVTSGGGIWIAPPQAGTNLLATLNNTWVAGNTAANQGGGIGVGWLAAGGSLLLTLRGDTFIGFNTLADQYAGGGGLFLGYGTATFDDVTFDSNTAWADATGFYAVSDTVVNTGPGGVTFDNDTWYIEV